jgi:hypothetical protein
MFPRKWSARVVFFVIVGQPSFSGMNNHFLETYHDAKCNSISSSRCEERAQRSKAGYSSTIMPILRYSRSIGGYSIAENSAMGMKSSQQAKIQGGISKRGRGLSGPSLAMMLLSRNRASLHSPVHRLNGGSGSDKHRLRKQRRIYWNSAHSRQWKSNTTHRSRNTTSRRNSTSRNQLSEPMEAGNTEVRIEHHTMSKTVF